MDIEKLKVIADGVGYETKVTPSRCAIKIFPYNYCPELPRWKLYNPLTNDTQCMEIIKRFQPAIDWINKDLCQATLYIVKPLADVIRSEYEGRGETINEAVCNAAYEVFKDGS